MLAPLTSIAFIFHTMEVNSDQQLLPIFFKMYSIPLRQDFHHYPPYGASQFLQIFFMIVNIKIYCITNDQIWVTQMYNLEHLK